MDKFFRAQLFETYGLVITEDDMLILNVIVENWQGENKDSPEEDLGIATPVAWIVKPSTGRIVYPLWIRITVTPSALPSCHIVVNADADYNGYHYRSLLIGRLLYRGGLGNQVDLYI